MMVLYAPKEIKMTFCGTSVWNEDALPIDEIYFMEKKRKIVK